MQDSTVYISGLGVVSALGTGVETTLCAFAEGAAQAGPVTLFETSLTQPVFAAPWPPSARPSRRTFDLCMVAAREALDQAGLPRERIGARTGVCLGTTVACQLNDLAFYTAYKDRAAEPAMDAVDRYLNGNLAEAVARTIGAAGPALTVVNACSSGADAIGTALNWIRQGLCDQVLAGGADELNRIPLCGFHSLGIMSDNVCRPFDRDRRGLNLGEGAGVLLLESARSIQARGASLPKLKAAGYGAAGDAHHLTAPRPDGAGLEEAIRIALRDADRAPEAMAFVNAHGTATPDNDRVEGGVLGRVFGDATPILSTKGYTGHTLGAAGGIEAVFTALALREGWIPASAGFENRDPDIPVAPVTRRTPIAGQTALSTSLAFGGNNAALVIAIDAP